MERWVGRVALVTGGGAGIGAAIVRLLSEQGMSVVAVDINENRLKTLAAEVKGEIHVIQCDVTKEDDVIRVVQWTMENLGGVDVLVNNAGIMHPIMLTEADTLKMRTMLELNVLAGCLFTREVLKNIKDRGVTYGHIFNINSIHGQSLLSRQSAAMYGGTKHALRVITEGLRKELIGTNIRVSSISPGRTRTCLAQIVLGCSPEEATKHYDSQPCLEAEDIAQALLFALAAPPHVEVHEITIQPVR